MSYQLAVQFYRHNRLQVLCTLYVVILAFGVITSIVLSDDSHWTNWSLSRLGETSTNRQSALSFNTGVFASGLILTAIGICMTRSYAKLQQSRTAKLSAWLMITLSVCMIGVALCPNDTMHAAHFVFSRGIIVAMVLMMLTLPSSLNYLTQRERLLSFGFPIFAAILAAQGYILRSFWFVIIEAILGLLAAIWLFIVCRHIDKRLRQ
ncbi:MAG: DUF998 domain-containing protein [Candidatus Saccharimonas sp.]